MNQYLLVVLLLLAALPAQARDMSSRETECYKQIKDEADFIVSRINLIHHDYENQVKQSALGRFKSGDYSTIKLLDNTIRKYHRKLVHKIKNYPFRYERRLRKERHHRHAHCLAQDLRNESVGTIHEFELNWRKALRQARKNARYFKQLDNME